MHSLAPVQSSKLFCGVPLTTVFEKIVLPVHPPEVAVLLLELTPMRQAWLFALLAPAFLIPNGQRNPTMFSDVAARQARAAGLHSG